MLVSSTPGRPWKISMTPMGYSLLRIRREKEALYISPSLLQEQRDTRFPKALTVFSISSWVWAFMVMPT